MEDEMNVLERILNGDEEPKDLPLPLLERITNDFSEERKIGQGGFGEVYKGELGNKIVAVKRIYVNEHTVDDKAFRREINSLMNINHQNVVRFLGFCSHTYHKLIKEPRSDELTFVKVNERLLCSEYISNGSLDKHITDELRGLEWETRYEIITGICKGMHYLHEDINIIHMDLKPPNILLDDQMVPKITDFGLSRSSRISRTMGLRFGTQGYFAPEYGTSGRTSSECDIYSLGAIITELVTGCMGVPNKNNVLRRWRHRWNNPPTQLQYQQVIRCIEIARRCREQNPEARPSIKEIIDLLGKSTDEHTRQESTYMDDDMLGIEPLELHFTFKLNEEMSWSVKLINKTMAYFAFNIKRPSKQYTVWPDKGIVPPECNQYLQITFQPHDMALQVTQNADKFVVKSMKVSSGLRMEHIFDDIFHEETGKVFDEVDLMVLYESSKSQESYKSREDTNPEVPKAEQKKFVGSVSGKGKNKLGSSENAETASMDMSSSAQGQYAKQLDRRNFHPQENFSHSQATYMTYQVRASDRAMDVTRGANLFPSTLLSQLVGPVEVPAVGWGISMAGWIISPYITRLLDKVYSHIKPNHKSRANLDKLVTHVIPGLKLVLEAADGSKHKVFFEALVRDLKSTFRDTEDILDELEYSRHHNEATQRKKKASQRKRKSPESGPSNQFLPLLKNDLEFQFPPLLKNDLEKNIKIIEGLIEEARTNLSIQNEVRVATGRSNLPGGSGSAVHGPNATAENAEKQGASPTGRVTGRDDVRDRIMRMLKNDGSPSSSDTCLSVIGIHGIPGSGKTTLAQYIFKSAETARYFDLVMWIHVSKKFSVDNIFSEIFEQAWKKDKKCPQYNSFIVLENNLKELLTGKRFLLVLDDIWCSENVNEQKKLQRLIPPLMAANTGSKILVTSRHKDAVLELGPEVRIIENSRIPELDDKVFLELLMHNAFGHRNRDVAGYRMLYKIGTEIAKKLRKSPLLASVVGGMLYKNHDVDHWRRIAEQKSLEKFMGPFWWCYQHLGEEAKRCFAYCSIFPRRGYLYCDELVNLWVAEGFISTTNEGCEMELVARGYFDELLSVSFLLPGGNDRRGKECVVIHDLLHDLAEMVAGSDCFKIENALTKAPSDVCHLSIESCSASMINDDIIKLENLRTLIIFHGEEDISEEVLEKMFVKLTKLRVFIFRNRSFRSGGYFYFPESIDYLKHLRYLGFEKTGTHKICLPGRIGALYLLEVLDIGFDYVTYYKFPEDVDLANLTNLRHVVSAMYVPFPNIGRLTSLQTMPPLDVGRGDGYELHQLGDLNNLRGNLTIMGLGAVNSKEEALRAKLADKGLVKSLSLSWHTGDLVTGYGVNSAEADANVLEGLCPPEGVESMIITGYKGSRYPEWMFGPEKSTMYMHTLYLRSCSNLVPAPVPDLFFVGVTSLELYQCSWDAMPYNMVHLTELQFFNCCRYGLPDNMDQLTSLKRLIIRHCRLLCWIGALPTSLQYFKLEGCDESFSLSCKDESHRNYKAIENIPEKHIDFGVPSYDDSDQEEVNSP